MVLYITNVVGFLKRAKFKSAFMTKVEVKARARSIFVTAETRFWDLSKKRLHMQRLANSTVKRMITSSINPINTLDRSPSGSRKSCVFTNSLSKRLSPSTLYSSHSHSHLIITSADGSLLSVYLRRLQVVSMLDNSLKSPSPLLLIFIISKPRTIENL